MNETFTFEGVEYTVSQFSQDVQNSIALMKLIQQDRAKAEVELVKCNGALETLNQRVSGMVKTELEAKKTPKVEVEVVGE